MTRYTHNGKYISFGSLVLYTPNSFCDEFKEVYNSWIEKPNNNDAIIWNNMVKSMVDTGEWFKMDRIHFMAIHTNNNGEAIINWKNPTNPLEYLITVNDPLFTPHEGFTTDGSSNYLDDQYIASTDGVNYTLNNASMSAFIRSDIISNGITVGYSDGEQWQGPTRFFNINGLGQFNAVVNDINGINRIYYQTNNIQGFSTIQRINETEKQLLQNKQLLYTEYGIGDLGLPNGSAYLGGISISGQLQHQTFRQFSAYLIGSSITEIEHSNLTNYIEISLESNGKGVL